jgi:hypothetical protein
MPLLTTFECYHNDPPTGFVVKVDTDAGVATVEGKVFTPPTGFLHDGLPVDNAIYHDALMQGGFNNVMQGRMSDGSGRECLEFWLDRGILLPPVSGGGVDYAFLMPRDLEMETELDAQKERERKEDMDRTCALLMAARPCPGEEGGNILKILPADVFKKIVVDSWRMPEWPMLR